MYGHLRVASIYHWKKISELRGTESSRSLQINACCCFSEQAGRSVRHTSAALHCGGRRAAIRSQEDRSRTRRIDREPCAQQSQGRLDEKQSLSRWWSEGRIMWHAALSLVTVSHVISLSSAIGMARLVCRGLLVACLDGGTAAPVPGIARGNGVLPDPLIWGDSHQQPTEPSLKHSISSILDALRRGTLALYDALIISPYSRVYGP